MPLEISVCKYVSISMLMNNGPKTYLGYMIWRNASKSLHLTLPSDMVTGKASWSRMPSWANRVEK